MAVAAIAAVIWAWTPQDSTAHALAYNAMVIGSVTTLLFNGNPLLRYDGYYMLSDLLEIPNLANRSKQYIYYLVRKYVWGVRHVRNPAHTTGEKAWFIFYGITSTAYRFFICFRILLFIADKLFMVGAVLAVASVFVWVMIPLGKFVHYLFTSGELIRSRGRAMLTTAGTLAILVSLLGLLPCNDRVRVDGVVWPDQMQEVHAQTPGWVHADYAPDGKLVQAGDVLVNSDNFEVETDLTKKLAEREGLKVEKMRGLTTGDTKTVAQADMALARVDKEIDKLQADRDELSIRAPLAGQWVAPDIDVLQGTYVKKGDKLGVVANLDKDLIIRCVAEQDYGPAFRPQAEKDKTMRAEIRIKGLPEIRAKRQGKSVLLDKLSGAATIEDMRVGLQQLPTAALGATAGGSIATDVQDPNHVTPASPVFEVRVHLALDDPDLLAQHVLWPGQRVVVRFHLDKKPLAVQWFRSLQQLIQRRGL
jgi:putative peptide zinc metalloprotease protein